MKKDIKTKQNGSIEDLAEGLDSNLNINQEEDDEEELNINNSEDESHSTEFNNNLSEDLDAPPHDYLELSMGSLNLRLGSSQINIMGLTDLMFFIMSRLEGKKKDGFGGKSYIG